MSELPGVGMTEQTDAAEVTGILMLAAEIRRVDRGHSLGAAALAEALWPFVATERARGAQAVLAAVEAIHTAWEPTGFRYTDGRQIPVCTVDEEVFPCSTLRAARAAAAAAGGGAS